MVKVEYPPNKEFIELLGRDLVHMQKDYEDSKALYIVNTPVCSLSVYEGEYIGYLGKEVYQTYTEAEVEEFEEDVETDLDEEFDEWYAQTMPSKKTYTITVFIKSPLCEWDEQIDSCINIIKKNLPKDTYVKYTGFSETLGMEYSTVVEFTEEEYNYFLKVCNTIGVGLKVYE